MGEITIGAAGGGRRRGGLDHGAHAEGRVDQLISASGLRR